MDFYYGKIAPGSIQNIPPVVASATGQAVFEPLEKESLKFVHYPDCQQLIIWLPRPGVEYSTLILRNIDTGNIREQWLVADKLSGAIQLLWDTLPVPPGNYVIEINLQNGGQHIVGIRKYKEGEEVPEEKSPAIEPGSGESIVYRDGFGNILPNEDLILRNKVLKEMADKFSRRIEYLSEGRTGYVIYIEGELQLRFYYEFGGGNCIAVIDIPATEQWEAHTKLPLSRRDDIIDFMATTVKNQQASGSRVKITDTAISFFTP